MARGSRTPDKQRAAFRSKYLLLGNASAAARALKMPATTGQDLAREAEDDPEFVKARADLYARALPKCLGAVMGIVDAAADRVHEPDLTPDELAAIATNHGLKSFSYQNPKPAYAKVVVDAYGKLLAAQKQATPDRDGNGQRIEVVFTDGAAEPETPPGEP